MIDHSFMSRASTHVTKNRIGCPPPKLASSNLKELQVMCPSTISSATMSFPSPAFLGSAGIACCSISVTSSSCLTSTARAGSRAITADSALPRVRTRPFDPIEMMKSAIGLTSATLCVYSLSNTMPWNHSLNLPQV